MQERWSISDRPGAAVDADAVAEIVEDRLATGTTTTWMGEALRIVAHLLAHGAPPADASWQVDRWRSSRPAAVSSGADDA